MRTAFRPLLRLLLSLVLTLPQLVVASVFDLPEFPVTPSPSQPMQIRLPEGVHVIDFDVSPIGPITVLLVSIPTGSQQIWFWGIGQPQSTKVLDVPVGLSARSVAWHPRGDAFFLSGELGQEFAIFKIENRNGTWTPRRIFSSRREIRRLSPGPRPFVIGYGEKGQSEIQAYRLFFGLKEADGGYSIHSITEDGQRDYQVVGRKDGFTSFKDAAAPPSELTASSALPVGFHPAGHRLLWEDAKHCFQVASYDRDHWSKSARPLGRNVCGGTLSVTPNGAALLHWVSGTAGIELLQGIVKRQEAATVQLISAPSSVADGRGIVGITKAGGSFAVSYLPIDVPLHDSINAWMYLESAQDAQLLARNGGLFRDLSSMDQLYSLYDTESYQCGHYDESTPTRPYFATTDSFWELFAAAYEGIFILRERQISIPAFWQFIAKTNGSLQRAKSQSQWARVFAALDALASRPESNDEATRILSANGSQFSPVLSTQFDYGELKPRGHYSSTPETQRYFRAFRYLTRVSALGWNTSELTQLAPDVKAAAMGWITSYQDMIAPSRSPLLWQNAGSPPPPYVKHPQNSPVLFPLSWGFDNETLFSTTFHPNLPEPERIDGPAGPRLQASSLDVAAALGSRMAQSLLSDEIKKYPKLENTLRDLALRYRTAEPRPTANLYERWIDSLAEQWADSTLSPNGALDERLWRIKRLQTGLASWATLRHATVLVNERSGAECGEGGFEFIVMRPPRGYVEPDPKTFGKIADLFGNAITLVDHSSFSLTGRIPDESQANGSLKQGLLHRLAESAAKARLFQSIAEKEVRGQALTAQEYEEILYFGRVAEHHFLVFKSLANKDLALSTPNPIPKIVDVSDTSGHAPYLLAGVGRPLEWDHTVPYFGRHEIVKGAAYSFYEFNSGSLLSDAEWLKRLPSQRHPAWVAPYISSHPLSCPARDPF